MEIEFFDRDKNEDLIPVTEAIDTRNDSFLKQISIHEEKLEAEKKEKNREVLKKVIELLKKEYERSGKQEKITFLPIMDFEFVHIRKGLDCEGKLTKDQNASILAQKLVEPKLSFEKARDMKDGNLKLLMVSKILEVSFPNIKKTRETEKKVLALLRKIET